MSADTVDQIIEQRAVRPHVRAVCDGRPPGQTWRREESGSVGQPPLVFSDPVVELGPPRPSQHRVHVVRSPWAAGPAKTLPDARAWSASLALAVAETLQGRRPVGQLSRWVDERVLATLTITRRQHKQSGTTGPRPVAAPSRPAVLHSVHLQFPTTEAVEVSAHVHVDGRSTAFAFRLDAWYDRWLCTALELGPRDSEV
ncbi:MAG: Rv3235 family protein [Propionibacteriaceae bacterium]